MSSLVSTGHLQPLPLVFGKVFASEDRPMQGQVEQDQSTGTITCEGDTVMTQLLKFLKRKDVAS